MYYELHLTTRSIYSCKTRQKQNLTIRNYTTNYLNTLRHTVYGSSVSVQTRTPLTKGARRRDARGAALLQRRVVLREVLQEGLDGVRLVAALLHQRAAIRRLALSKQRAVPEGWTLQIDIGISK